MISPRDVAQLQLSLYGCIMKHSWTDFHSVFIVTDDKTSLYLIKTSCLENMAVSGI
jgi:hypothetical protein